MLSMEGVVALYGALLSTYVFWRQTRKPRYIAASRHFRFVGNELEWSIFLSNIGPSPTTVISVESRNFRYQ
jgi:hypothetical protein